MGKSLRVDFKIQVIQDMRKILRKSNTFVDENFYLSIQDRTAEYQQKMSFLGTFRTQMLRV